METENVLDRPNDISVYIGLQNVMDRYGTDQKAIRYNRNIVLISNKRRYEERWKIVKPIIFQRNVFYRSKWK